MNVRIVRLPIVIAALALLLTACGAEIDPSPTVVPSATPEAATPTGLTAGQLSERIGVGWGEIDRYRAVTTTQTIGSPAAGSVSRETVEEVILPDQRRHVVSVNGVVQSEIVSAGGNIYGRGPALPGIVQTNRDPDVWITINGNVLGPDNAASGFYQSLLLPVQPPVRGVEPERSRQTGRGRWQCRRRWPDVPAIPHCRHIVDGRASRDCAGVGGIRISVFHPNYV